MLITMLQELKYEEFSVCDVVQSQHILASQASCFCGLKHSYEFTITFNKNNPIGCFFGEKEKIVAKTYLLQTSHSTLKGRTILLPRSD